MNLIRGFFLILCFLMLTPVSIAAGDFDNSLQKFLQQTRQAGCLSKLNQLETILCKEEIRVGVRSNYRQFGFQPSNTAELQGFEIDLSMEIAKKLGVEISFQPVTPANRIEKLTDGSIDIVVATMAHTTTREAVIDFVRPHYYSSPTSVYGPKTVNVTGWSDLDNKSVCVPLGSYSNISFADHQVRLMIYDNPKQMIDALRLGACTLISHDQSFLKGALSTRQGESEWSTVYEEKFYFNNVPWGIGIRKSSRENLGIALALIIAELHASGKLLEIANKHDISTDFLQAQHELWQMQSCYNGTEDGFAQDCLLMPASLIDQPSALAKPFSQFENWIYTNFDLSLRFPMFTGKNALEMFINGVLISFALVFGSVIASLGFAIGFFRLAISRYLIVRLPSELLRIFFQNSPIILLLLLGYLCVTFLTEYSASVAVAMAIVVIGLNNGSTGASALLDASKTFPQVVRILVLVRVASVQLRACMINAAKASPIAAFVGAPEMLSVLTDITSFTGDRVMTYVTLSLFYLVVVLLVVFLMGKLAQQIDKNVSLPT